MLNELLERMVKEAGFKVFGDKIVAADEGNSGLANESVKRLIEIVRADEREACAKACESLDEAEDCAVVIRMRSNEQN